MLGGHESISYRLTESTNVAQPDIICLPTCNTLHTCFAAQPGNARQSFWHLICGAFDPGRQGELVAAYQKSDLRRENEQQLQLYR